MSTTAQNHLRQRHLKEVKKALKQNEEFGAGQTGLGLKELMKPIEFSKDLPEEQRACTCPYCKERPAECSRWQTEMSTRAHLRKCNPGKSLRDMYKDAQKEGGNKYDMAKWTAAKKEEKSVEAIRKLNKVLGKHGYDIIKVDVKWPRTV